MSHVKLAGVLMLVAALNQAICCVWYGLILIREFNWENADAKARFVLY